MGSVLDTSSDELHMGVFPTVHSGQKREDAKVSSFEIEMISRKSSSGENEQSTIQTQPYR